MCQHTRSWGAGTPNRGRRLSCVSLTGVGKSSVSAQLALALYATSTTARVGILDVDLTGPSIPRMLGLDGHPVHQSSEGWVPVYADGTSGRLGCMSVGFLLKKREDSVVWRGPKKNAMIRQFLSDVRWGELDYLVIDTPPGSSFHPQPVSLAILTASPRHFRRTPFPPRAPCTRSLPPFLRHRDNSASSRTRGCAQMPLFHTHSLASGSWAHREHERVCVSVLWRN